MRSQRSYAAPREGRVINIIPRSVGHACWWRVSSTEWHTAQRKLVVIIAQYIERAFDRPAFVLPVSGQNTFAQTRL